MDPTVTDNSGVDPAVTSTSSNPELFYAGSYIVQYVAADEASNEATCEFSVVIESKNTTLFCMLKVITFPSLSSTKHYP